MKLIVAALLGSLAVIGLAAAAPAKPWWTRGVESNDSDFLPPDVAFRVGTRLDGDTIKVRWVIADGYYLYRQRLQITADSPGLVLDAPEFPAGHVKTDPYLGTQEIYLQQVEATVRYTRADFGAHPLEIKVTYQGCAEAGLCYPPITKVLSADRGGMPAMSPPLPHVAAHPWEGFAIAGGGAAFLSAGFLLRKGRRLDLPPA